MNYELPADNIAEVTVIGTGGGYGEAIVVHLGNQNWITIDSCKDPNGNNLTLKYLTNLGVPLDNVSYVVATHWHDDHINGISEIYASCNQARFVMSRNVDAKKFARLIALESEKIVSTEAKSSFKEFESIIETLKERGVRFTEAIKDRLIKTEDVGDETCHFMTLSPSDESLALFNEYISELIEKYGQTNLRIVSEAPNLRSIVSHFKFGSHFALLGADMEVHENDKIGWLEILNNRDVAIGSSSYFKIPHHGSDTGFEERIWNELLLDGPISSITPWTRKGKLPKARMLELYCGKTHDLYKTSPYISDDLTGKPKRRMKQIAKVIRSFNGTIKEIKFKEGIIQSRIDINNPEAKWVVQLENFAVHVNKLIHKKS